MGLANTAPRHMTLLVVLPALAAAAIFVGTFRTRPGSRIRKVHRLAVPR